MRPAASDAAAVVEDALADLGHLVRRAQAATLTEDAFQSLTRRLRTHLRVLRADAFSRRAADAALLDLADLVRAAHGGPMDEAKFSRLTRRMRRALIGVRQPETIELTDAGRAYLASAAKPQLTLIQGGLNQSQGA